MLDFFFETLSAKKQLANFHHFVTIFGWSIFHTFSAPLQLKKVLFLKWKVRKQWRLDWPIAKLGWSSALLFLSANLRECSENTAINSSHLCFLQTIKLLNKFLECHVIEDIYGRWRNVTLEDNNQLYR